MRMALRSLYLGKLYILEGLILPVALYFSIKSCAEPLLVTRFDTLSLETDYYSRHWSQLTDVTIQLSFDLW